MIVKRVLACFIDAYAVALIIFPIIMLTDISSWVVTVVGGCLMILKDLSGRSIGKRLLKLQVKVEEKRNPKFFSLILRNITLVLWPIETVVLLTKKKRLGDYLAGTNVT